MSSLAVQKFRPEQFDIISDENDLVLDPVVAADIASAVYCRHNNGAGADRNTAHTTDYPFIVDTRLGGYSSLPHEYSQDDDQTLDLRRESGYRVHIPYASGDTYASEKIGIGEVEVNRTFAWGLQRLLDSGEKDARLGNVGVLALLGFSGIMSATPGGALCIANSVSENSGGAIYAALPAFLIGAKHFVPEVRSTARHMVRNSVTKPDTVANRVHMRRTLRQVSKLDLSPMLYKIER